MRINKLYKSINYFALAILAGTVIASCQKQAVTPARAIETDGAILGPPPPPVLLAWSVAPKLPLTNDIPGIPPIALEYPLAFSIGGKGYVCGGITEASDAEFEHLGETWAFDTVSRSWSQMTNIPTDAIEAENFVIGNSAYVCNGFNNQNWQYNQGTNAWTQKSDIPFVARAKGVGMSINGKGYIGLGTYQVANETPQGPNFLDAADWWQYDPGSDTWTRKAEFPGGKREGAAAFVVNGKGYVATGWSLTKGYYSDCWQYDPIADSWSKVADFPGGGRSDCAGLSGIQAGYVATGANSTKSFNDCWQYVPATNTWSALPEIGGVFGPGYAGAAAFSIGTTLYLGAGFVGQQNIGLNFWFYPHGK